MRIRIIVNVLLLLANKYYLTAHDVDDMFSSFESDTVAKTNRIIPTNDIVKETTTITNCDKNVVAQTLPSETVRGCCGVCDEEMTGSENGVVVTWPESYSHHRVLSEPRCLDKNMQFVSRKCCNSDWIPTVVESCDSVQQVSHHPLDRFCPSGYDFVENLCIMVTKKSRWSDVCFTTGGSENIFTIGYNDKRSKQSRNLLSLKAIIAHLRELGVYKIWLPARRLEKYGYFAWVLLGQNWKEPVKEAYIHGNQKDGECISLDIDDDEYKMDALDCNIELPMVCVQHATSLSHLTCPEDLYTTTYPENQNFCYGFRSIARSTWSETYTNIIQADTVSIQSEKLNQIFQSAMITAERLESCWMALEKKDNGFHWKDGTSVSYVNWDVNEDYVGSFAAIHKNGTWSLQLAEERLDCYLYARKNVVPEPEIVLKFYPNWQRLELVIYRPESLFRFSILDVGVKCFTDANEKLFESVPIGDKFWESDWDNYDNNHNFEYTANAHKIIYDIPLQKYPGNYWCEGHALKTLTLITSEKVFAHEKYFLHIYSLLTELPFNVLYPETEHPKAFSGNEEVEVYRVQNILRIAENRTLAIVQMILKQPLTAVSDAEEIIRSYGKAKQIVEEINANGDARVINMNNTLYCIPEEYMLESEDSHINKIKWTVAELGHRITTPELCLQQEGLPIYRSCIGDNIFGAVWQNHVETCDTSSIQSPTTRSLFELSMISINNANHADNVSKEVLQLITKANILIPADIYYIGLILEKISMSLNIENVFNSKEVISNIVSQTSRANITHLRLSQISLNSTSRMTDSVQRLLEINPVQKKALKNTDDGTTIIRSPEFIWQTSNPAIKSVTGMALVKRNQSLIGNLDDYDIIPIMSNQDLSGLLEIEGIEASTWIPQDLLERIEETSYEEFQERNLTIVIAIYNKDSLFQEGRGDFFSDRVMSVSIPGYGPNIPIPLQIIFRQNYHYSIATNATTTCGYWNYKPKKGNIMGDWYKDGCVKTLVYETSNGNLTVCSCSHLTNFAQLITGNFKTNAGNEEYDRHEKILDVITIIGCSLSMLGILGIFAIATLFKSWRTKTGTKVLLHLSSAIMVQMIIMILFNTDAIQASFDESNSFNFDRLPCVIAGAMLHYSVIASFCWMIIIAFMQYMRYVRVLGVVRPAKFMIKSALIAWGCPLIPVLLNLFIDWSIYIPKSELESMMCYPSGLALYLGVVLPITIILLINLALYGLVLRSIFERPKDSLQRNFDSNLISSQLRVSVFLFFLLGLTWLFGLLMNISESIMFAYLFCITATLQGFALFMYFIVIDPSTRKLWKCFGKREISSSYAY